MDGITAEVLAALPARVECVVLVRTSVAADAEPSAFVPAGPAPAWFAEIFGSAAEAAERSAVLEDFIGQRAADHWRAGEHDPLSSGFWEEGEGRYFEALAWSLGKPETESEVDVLLIRSVDEAAKNRQQLIQRNHQQVLDRRRLAKEMEKKEILLDCIVHDLSGPVGTLIMNLEHIGRKLSDVSSLQPAVERALNQARRQLVMIRSISQLFDSDLVSAGGPDPGAEAGVDIIAVAHEMTDLHRPADASCRLQFRLQRQDPMSAEALRVVGREAHLSRVMENLLLNALRHVGEDGEIIVTVTAGAGSSGGDVEVSVEDNGPGVGEDRLDDLFRLYSQGGAHPGQAGLGLYFCRLVIENYGGSIGYREASGGRGACFWFTLPQCRPAR